MAVVLSCYHSESSGVLHRARSAKKVWKIAITGGPCGGKSSSRPLLQQALEKRGFRVFMVPEVATVLMGGGLDFACPTSEKRLTQQRVILQTMLTLEDAFEEMVSFETLPCIVLCDRGTMDCRSYCTDEQWAELLGSCGYSESELCFSRYDAVVHLASTACGLPHLYGTESNAVRRESIEEAARLDALALLSWSGHPRVSSFDNSTDFTTKIERMIDFVLSVVHS